MHLFIGKLRRNLAFRNAQRKPFGNCCFPYARLANQARVIFLTAVQDLNHSIGFPCAANNAVKPPLTCFLGQIITVADKVFTLFLLLFWL